MATRTISRHTRTERRIRTETDWRVPVSDSWARAARIEVPLLAVIGGVDTAGHIGTAERLARPVAGGRATTVDGTATAHYPNRERPDVFNGLVEEFRPHAPVSPAAARYGTTVTGQRPAFTSRIATDPMSRCPACSEAPTTTASALSSSAAVTRPL